MKTPMYSIWLVMVLASAALLLAGCGGGAKVKKATPPPVVNITLAGGVLLTDEAGTSATFDVTLPSEPTADVAISVTSDLPAEAIVSGGAALLFTPTGGLSPWDVPQTVTVSGVDEAIADGEISYTVTLTLTSADQAFNAKTAQVDGLNADNEIPGVIINPQAFSGFDTVENGRALVYDIFLANEPTGTVTLNFTSSDTTEGTVTPTLSFDGTDWATPKQLTITPVDDVDVDGVMPFDITADASASTNVAYKALPPEVFNFWNMDDDTGQEFVATGLPVAIPDVSWVSHNLIISGETTSIMDVDVYLDITHTYDADLRVSITSPLGTTIFLTVWFGSFFENYTGTIFDDEATTFIGAGTAPFTGRFQPVDPLSWFDGQDANGTWTITVFDDAGGDFGTLNNWGLTIN